MCAISLLTLIPHIIIVLHCVVSSHSTKRAVRLWFPVADTDLDGSITATDFDFHYDYQAYRMEELFLKPPTPESVLHDMYDPALPFFAYYVYALIKC